ncbi:C-type lectin domain family 4 member F-like isoform X2 [Alligator mississippiensis]|uniref:C-type lectin domain family 4 member F-like isoform X2 n=1 Tax=Alligator mississippiensis TaxID=8496 RepID=UPI00287788AA|nr:C-type lectin domain family 4 member F-like isoform X2 [Alligator mississippiensis]
MKAAAEEPVYGNMIISAVPRQSFGKGNLPESSPKRSRVLYALLLLLSVLLMASLGGVTAKCFQERREKHQVAEAVQRVRDFWKENSTVNMSVMEQTGQQLVGEIQPLLGLWEEIVSPCAVLQEQYHFQEQREKRQMAEAVQGIRDFWKQNSTLNKPNLDQTGSVVTKLSQGWRHHGGNLYYFSEKKSSWEEAEHFCMSQNSHLSSVLSREEQEYLATQVKGADQRWIGLSDREAEGSWRWVDGSKYTAGFWTESQPDNWDQGVGGTEDCVHLSEPHYERWNDANCTLQHRWICKAALG